MTFPWADSRRAFADGADWFRRTTAAVGDRWKRPGLGEWDVRALVGHTSRSLVTVAEYLGRPASSLDVASPADYLRVTREIARGPEVTERGRAAAVALGDDPPAAVAGLAARVTALVDSCDGTELVTTIAGGMRLVDYLPTRTFELAVHTCDLATALELPLDVPRTAAVQALQLISELAADDGRAGALLLAATGRTGLPTGFSLL